MPNEHCYWKSIRMWGSKAIYTRHTARRGPNGTANKKWPFCKGIKTISHAIRMCTLYAGIKWVVNDPRTLLDKDPCIMFNAK